MFNYGQRHARELDCAFQLAHYYGATYERIQIDPRAMAGSCLTGAGEIPHAHYEDASQIKTVVPNRNAVFLSLAAAAASRRGIKTVMFAAHQGDATIYPDCRPEFIQAFDVATKLSCGVSVYAPFVSMTKRSIVLLGRKLAVPFDMTWSCYEGGMRPCGLCGACVERAEAMSA
jgi:7-cyano-7-deazaguanine synthase